MNKRLLWLGVVIALALLVVILAVTLRKPKASLRETKAEPSTLSGLIAQAKDFQEKGSSLEAKSVYQRLINEFPESNEVMNWQKTVEDINIRLLFSPALTPKSILYEIKPGDTLDKIAMEFKTTSELIMKSNNLSSDKILPGRKIKVWNAPFSIVVDKSQNTLILKTNEEIIKTYMVSTGTNNSTPVGNFKIVNKIPNPTWFKAGAVVAPGSPDNILGSRWLGFNIPGYGIHGTTDPQNLGKQVTQGCVRVLNSEVEELYAIVPVGTEVTIID
ncbi:MAG: L,D-transpeptidase family protein [Candidatus Omnitrophica bacterium]|nr:L,D-transpeptidase family protein [Candidatus Omnitrophota bacterium]